MRSAVPKYAFFCLTAVTPVLLPTCIKELHLHVFHMNLVKTLTFVRDIVLTPVSKCIYLQLQSFNFKFMTWELVEAR